MQTSQLKYTTNDKYNESIASMLSLSGIGSFFNLGFKRTKVSNNNDLIPRHNNVLQFLDVSKNCQVT